MKKFWQELKRRKVIRVAVVYIIGAWVAVEAASVLFPALLLPDWTTRLVVALALIGFPVTVVLAWAFDVTEGGFQKTPGKQSKPAASPIGSPDSSPDPEDRLDGWKRIALFLNRDVRTVRRWESAQNLPIHRVVHLKGATVYAYRSELTTWLDGSDPQTRNTSFSKRNGKAEHPATRWIGIGATLIIAVAASGYWWLSDRQAIVPFGLNDWVLITQFDNRSGEEVLDGTLEYALERELNNSVFVKVIPRYRIEDVLRLMKMPVDSNVDVETGRQISLRDGAVSILLTGRIDKVGETYSLTVTLVKASDGVTINSLSSISADQSSILQTVAKLSVEVRQTLGEELDNIESYKPDLARVSTHSLQALQIYSRAENLMRDGSNRFKAMPLLKQAIRIDPEFASAHLLLHYLYLDIDDSSQANFHLQKAMTLSDKISERERLFIISTDHLSRPAEWQQGIDILEILSGIYTDHFWANSNLATQFQEMGDYEEKPTRIDYIVLIYDPIWVGPNWRRLTQLLSSRTMKPEAGI